MVGPRLRFVSTTTGPRQARPAIGGSTPWLPLAAAGVTVVLWASAFVAIRHLAGTFDPGALAFGRLALGSVCLGVLSLRYGVPRPTRRQWLGIVVVGALWYSTYHVALNAGEHHVDAGTASLLILTAPVFVAVLAALFLEERMTRTIGIGLALALAGVALIGFSGNGGGDDQHLLGSGLCLISALAAAISMVVQKKLLVGMRAIQLTWLTVTVGAVICLPFVGQFASNVHHASGSSIAWLVFLGVGPTAIAYTTYGFALSQMSATQAGILTYLIPPITIVLGLLFLGEAPPALAYLGGLVTLVGVIIARRHPRPAAH